LRRKWQRLGGSGRSAEADFLLFHENVRSERELVRRLPERLDWLWFLGYGLADESPHHSVLSKARARWGGELFEELFARTVRQCTEAGLAVVRRCTSTAA
jgi:IS5 family transposase